MEQDPRSDRPDVLEGVRSASSAEPERRRDAFRDWTRTDVARAVAVVVAAAVFLLPVALLLVRNGQDAAAATKAANGYTPPSLALASGKQYTGPVVAIVGDESAITGAAGVSESERWPALVGTSLDSAVDVIGVADGGYATTGSDGVTFLNAAADLPSDADVVLFVGGSNDANASAAALGSAASNSLSAAAERAPGAAVAVVGPVITGGLSATRLAGLKSVLRSVASGAGVPWVDPAAAGWLPKARAAGTDLTAADERAVATKVEALVERLNG